MSSVNQFNGAALALENTYFAPVLTGCRAPPGGLDQTATFCGAVAGSDWTTGWTRFPG